MDLRRLTDDFAVAPQIEVADVAEAAALGYRTLICNRPDGESADQPPVADIAAAAEAHGMRFIDIPFSSGALSMQLIAKFGAALADAPRPALAYCRSGTRSCMIWALTRAGEMPTDDILAAAARGGYDMDGLRPTLESGKLW
ncbi:MAG: TIGR01244 family sulfur transferase [Rubrimonas sp.]|uniref:TIGR01244 family sulfur transferase n=1 Tax=Rubrimonas sp. TaxID=2036015 RepID=UPI002FDD726A